MTTNTGSMVSAPTSSSTYSNDISITNDVSTSKKAAETASKHASTYEIKETTTVDFVTNKTVTSTVSPGNHHFF